MRERFDLLLDACFLKNRFPGRPCDCFVAMHDADFFMICLNDVCTSLRVIGCSPDFLLALSLQEQEQPPQPQVTCLYHQHNVISPYACVRMRELRVLACCSLVTLARSQASPCLGEAFTLPACHACGRASPYRAHLFPCHIENTYHIGGT